MKLILVGGFLGSGKSTAIKEATLLLKQRNMSTGVITNDQGEQLVDSRFVKTPNVPSLEVPNGCFCCNYEDLHNCITVLQTTVKPEIIFAESVGSCTDLVATVVKPLSLAFDKIEIIVSIFVDATLVESVFQESMLFSKNVSYIYKKQLEEADILILNKIDLLTPEQIKRVKDKISSLFPDKTILLQNSQNERHIDNWIKIAGSLNPQERNSLKIDYDIYGAGEADLSWFDSIVEIHSKNKKALSCALKLIRKINQRLRKENIPIGHLKFLLSEGTHQHKISFTSSGLENLSFENGHWQKNNIELLINARAQCSPHQLKEAIYSQINNVASKNKVNILQKNTAVFIPGYPRPTHRIA
ncbi:MAG: hypothetical protein CL868_11595 [Cytophagaceae bacterium]|nr:hypothetical protein [Cytophagaceae bacterium]